MTRLETLVLDAIRHAPKAEVEVIKDIYPYLSARRLFFSSGGIYLSLSRLENKGLIGSRYLEGRDPKRRVYFLIS